jgi:hypothetical protein
MPAAMTDDGISEVDKINDSTQCWHNVLIHAGMCPIWLDGFTSQNGSKW